jgi:hypothetical protein
MCDVLEVDPARSVGREKLADACDAAIHRRFDVRRWKQTAAPYARLRYRRLKAGVARGLPAARYTVVFVESSLKPVTGG